MPDTFTRFRELPLELRQLIWREALSMPVVLSVIVSPHGGPSGTNHIPGSTAIRYIGPTAFHVGDTCWEARKVMESMFKRVTFQSSPPLPKITPLALWVNFDSTVFSAPVFFPWARYMEPDHGHSLKHMALYWRNMHPGSLSKSRSECTSNPRPVSEGEIPCHFLNFILSTFRADAPPLLETLILNHGVVTSEDDSQQATRCVYSMTARHDETDESICVEQSQWAESMWTSEPCKGWITPRIIIWGHDKSEV